MTDAQLAAWQRHVLDARRRVEQFQVAGNPTGVPEDAAILAADKIVVAAREYVAALAEVTRVYDAGEMTVGDAQAICESKTDALVAAVGGAADAAKP